MKKKIFIIALISSLSSLFFYMAPLGSGFILNHDGAKAILLIDSSDLKGKSVGADLLQNKYENESMDNDEEVSSYEKQFEIPQKLYSESMKKVMTAPSEEESADFVSTNFWSCIGPFGFQLQGTQWTNDGRCLDYKFENTFGPPLVATSQGGLWKAAGTPDCLTDNIPPLSISTFDSDPINTSKIIIGTGDASGSGLNTSYLSGVWITTNAGTNWSLANCNVFPDYIYKIRYSGIAGICYMSASQGFYRSTDGGSNWNRILALASTDFDFEGFNVYASVVGGSSNSGVWKSVNAGANFVRLSGLDGVAPQNRMIDLRISVAASLPSRIYLNITDGPTVGVYKSENSGTSWQNTNIGADIHYGQGIHNNAIAISPVDANLILAAGGAIFRTTNNGTTWVGINAPNSEYHTDITRIIWRSDGSEVYAASDGGIHRSSNGGLNWTSLGNNLPITQIYNMDVAVKNNQFWVISASQDNGIALVKNATANFPGTWISQLGGDGGDVCILEENPDCMLASNWGQGGDKLYRTINAGVSWGQFAFQNSGNNKTKFDDDRLGPNAWFYKSVLNVVSYSQDLGATWQPVGGGGNFASNVYNLSVCKFDGSSVAYITTEAGNRNIWVYESSIGSWQNRGTGLPNVQYRKVAVHPRNSSTAYTLVSTAGEPSRIYKTTNRGNIWLNATGDLMSVARAGIFVFDIVPHPVNDNLLYIGTNFGCWRTTNAGVNWQRWNYGMPMGNDIRDMEFIDSAAGNKFYIIASSHGRGVWTRDANSDDPLAVNNNNGSIPQKYSLYQNYPNPFNPSTTIKFDLPITDNVIIKVYDIAGREVKTLINQRLLPGVHEIKFDGSDLSSGVYFYKFESSRMTDVKKMILIK